MQTTINGAAMRVFDGDIYRFGIFTLIMREAFLDADQRKPISVHSMSASLSRPFETVRRHVGALIDAGLCTRVAAGVVPSADVTSDPRIGGLLVLASDCFVRLTEDLAALGLLPALRVSDQPVAPGIGAQYAIDVMLGTVDANTSLHEDWMELTVYSTILCANAQRHAAATRAAPDHAIDTPLDARHAVRASVVARALGIPETTVRRRVAAMTGEGKPLVRTRSGLLVSKAWHEHPAAQETSAISATNVRRVLARAAANGFPFHAIQSAYIAGRPALPVFA